VVRRIRKAHDIYDVWWWQQKKNDGFYFYHLKQMQADNMINNIKIEMEHVPSMERRALEKGFSRSIGIFISKTMIILIHSLR
jgi:hypothetical protein